jgi:hypothetical protein
VPFHFTFFLHHLPLDSPCPHPLPYPAGYPQQHGAPSAGESHHGGKRKAVPSPLASSNKALPHSCGTEWAYRATQAVAANADQPSRNHPGDSMAPG